MIYDSDPYLAPYREAIDARHDRILAARAGLETGGSLYAGVNNHFYYGLHKNASGDWVFREYAPNATRIWLIGDFNNWRRTNGYALEPLGDGSWEIVVPAMLLRHGQLYKIFIEWPGGGAERIPAYAVRAVQDTETKAFCAQVWDPAEPYRWQNARPGKKEHPFIYECHIGMSSEEEKVASFEDFRREVLPRVAALGYDVLQIMALQEHPYYGSFGYQVSNFFALSSRFGTPEEFKRLVDEAHGMGISVIMDIVHSHSVSNEAEGLSMFDGREDLYFYGGPQGHHPAWDSRCFNYGLDCTRSFLLSNCKFWMEEYMLDGFRFDGVTSMMYWDHGLEKDFGDYRYYFDGGVDESAVTYLSLACQLTQEIYADAILIAEDVSGMPGLAAPFSEGGVGFGFRMAMGIADHWIKWIKERSDEQWSPGEIWWELTNKRVEERTISYAECHDQALVGDKTIIFRLIDKDMYWSMDVASDNMAVDRGMALHKMIRLVTASAAGGGYLNFMGNEYGQPEWIDFPREGNGWSYAHARRQWSLADREDLRFRFLREFDKEMVHFLRSRSVLFDCPELLRADEEKNILIFKRKKCIFAFNFNPVGSFGDYGFEAPAGTFVLALSSDDERFGGFGRVVPGESHTTSDGKLRLYLPSRTALVFEEKI